MTGPGFRRSPGDGAADGLDARDRRRASAGDTRDLIGRAESLLDGADGVVERRAGFRRELSDAVGGAAD